MTAIRSEDNASGGLEISFKLVWVVALSSQCGL